MAGAGAIGVGCSPSVLKAMEMGSGTRRGEVKANPNFNPDVELDLMARPGDASILAGRKTGVFRYSAKLIKGPKETLIELPGSYLGPVLQFRKGQKVRINFKNGISEESIVHWHGLHVPAEQDGHPMDAVAEGQERVFEFEILNRAGFHIYHPHPHERTASQVYYGLAGGILVRDEEEDRLQLPSGEHEIPMVLQDRRFDSDNQLIYGRSMHDRTLGFLGDRILVNGRADAGFEVASRAYRLRLLNGSNSRIYKLGWSDGSPVTVIGVDGGLLEVPENLPYVMFAPGERLDLWVDFTGRSHGDQVTLKSFSYRGALPKMHEEMMGRGGMSGMGMMGHHALPAGSEFPIASFRVTRLTKDSPKLPSHLCSYRHYRTSEVANPNQPVPIGVSEGPGSMLLNGRPYAAGDIQSFERIAVNSLQLLEIFHAHGAGARAPSAMGEAAGHDAHAAKASESNDGSTKVTSGSEMAGMNHDMGGMGGMGMMLSMAHPIHLHGQQFQVISRTTGGMESHGYDTVREGLVSSGFKDTVLLMPGERIRIIKPFDDFKGRFMYHCHNLEHEDLGMMREFEIY